MTFAEFFNGPGSRQFEQIIKELKHMADQFTDDVVKLTAAVVANTAAINTLAGLVTSDTATITDLQKQIADLKAAQPVLDLTALEDGIAKLAANNAAATEAIPVAPVVG